MATGDIVEVDGDCYGDAFNVSWSNEIGHLDRGP